MLVLSHEWAAEIPSGRERDTAWLYLGGGFLASEGITLALFLFFSNVGSYDPSAVAAGMLVLCGGVLGVPLVAAGAIKRATTGRRATDMQLENLAGSHQAAGHAGWQPEATASQLPPPPPLVAPGPPGWGPPPS